VTALAFEVLDLAAATHVAAPQLVFRLQVKESSGAVVHAIALRCQVRIEPQRRTYDSDEQAGLLDLFGPVERHATTVTPFLWTHATATVQGFHGATEFDLPVACTYDFDVAATKYLHALGGGSVPLLLLFSGTVFTRGENGFAAEQLSWELEARYDLPVATWRAAIDATFPGTGWVRLDKDTIAALGRYRGAQGLTSWDQTITKLLGQS
jgi:hypothetical protein